MKKKKETIIGIDPSINSTGIIVMDMENSTNILHHGVIFLKNKKDLEVLDKVDVIINEIEKIIKKYKPKYYCIEKAINSVRKQSSSAYTLFNLFFLQNLIHYHLQYKIKIHGNVVHPKTARKKVLGCGNLSKEEVYSTLSENYDFLKVKDEKITKVAIKKKMDESDALLLALFQFKQLEIL